MEREDNKANNPTDGKNQPGILWPTLINVISSYRARANAEKEQRNKREADAVRWAKWAAFGTWAAAVVGFGAAIVVFWQLDAMQSANKIASDNFIQGSRPFMVPDKFVLGPQWDEKGLITLIDIPFVFKNTGETPALKTACWTGWSNTETGLGEEVGARDIVLDIGPDQTADCLTLRLNREQLLELYRTNTAAYFYAKVEYSDAFQGTPVRHTNLCGRVTAAHNPDVPGDSKTVVIHVRPVAPCTNSD